MPLHWPDAAHIYLSPHLDDVVLSCGGMLFNQVQRGESAAVITVFAASPPASSPLSPFAQSLHARWQASAPPGADFSDPPAIRREEDLRALACLGSQIEVIHHDLPDCIYRRGAHSGEALYASEESLFGDVHPDDPAVTDLRSVPPLPAGAALYIPFGVGHHVDHQIIHRAALSWSLMPERVYFFEEYPYGTDRDAVAETQSQHPNWRSCTIPLTDQALMSKTAAVAEYASQISTFWRSLEEMREALLSYHALTGGETLWQAPGHIV